MLELIVANSTVRSYDRGEIVFAAGDGEGGLYAVETGSVALTVDGLEGDRRVLTIQEPGQLVRSHLRHRSQA